MTLDGNYAKINLTNLFNIGGTKAAGSTTETTSTEAISKPVEIASSNTVGRTDLDDVNALSNRAKINSPEAQGLASAEQIQSGQLVGPYYFDNLGKYDAKMFALKYNSANTPSIANGTNYACENIEFAGVAGNIEAAAKNSPFAELFYK